MSAFDEFAFSAEEFPGTGRLFPLPNLVLFPHVMQPLHIFEPRYREMLQDALAGDRLITMGTLKPGWENDYYGRPAVSPMACLGRVAVHHRLEAGSYNILLVGLRRVRLLRELPAKKSFREATMEICEDCYPAEEPTATAALKRRLRDCFVQILPHLPQAHEQVDQLLSGQISLGTLTDVISYVLDIPLEDKQRLLSEANVHCRAEMLLGHLSAVSSDTGPAVRGSNGFPPDFSAN